MNFYSHFNPVKITMIPSCTSIQHTQLATALLWIATIVLWETPASGQIVRIRPGLGIHVTAPYANIHIAPRRGRSIDEKGANDGSSLPQHDRTQRRAWGRRLGLRRLIDPALARPSKLQLAELPLEPKPENSMATQEGLEAGSPTIATAPTLAATTPREIPERAHQFPNTTELKHLDNAQLFDTLRETSSRLATSLANFKTGPGWQHYLQLAENAFSLQGIDQELLLTKITALRETQTRFEQVANNPDFRIIADQPNFVATLLALREVTARWDASKTVTKTNTPTTIGQQETLPTPEPAPKRHASPGEHSILKR